MIPPSTKQLGLILFSFDLSSSERGRYQQSHFTSLCCTEECLFHHPHSNGSYSPISLTPTCLSLVNQVPKSYRHSPHIISEENQLDVPLMTLNMFQPSFSITKCLPPSVARCSQPRQPIGFVTRGRCTRIYWNLSGLLSVMLPTSLLRCFSHSLGHLDPELQYSYTDGQQQHTLDPILSAFARQELIRISPIFAGIFSKHRFVHSRPSLLYPWSCIPSSADWGIVLSGHFSPCCLVQ